MMRRSLGLRAIAVCRGSGEFCRRTLDCVGTPRAPGGNRSFCRTHGASQDLAGVQAIAGVIAPTSSLASATQLSRRHPHMAGEGRSESALRVVTDTGSDFANREVTATQQLLGQLQTPLANVFHGRAPDLG